MAFKVQTAVKLRLLLYRDQKLTLLIFFKNYIPDMSKINKSNTDEVINLDTNQDSNSVSESLSISSDNISIECNRNGVLKHKILSNGFDPLLK